MNSKLVSSFKHTVQSVQKRNLTLTGFQNYQGAKKAIKKEKIQAVGFLGFMVLVAPWIFWKGEEGAYVVNHVWAENNKPIGFETQKNVRFPWTCGQCTPFDPICFRECSKEIEERKAAYARLTK